jgi:integral membrane protein (TIGR01906 family)
MHLVLLVILALWAWRGGWIESYQRGLSRGGFLTISLLIVIGLVASISFRQFFTVFHSLFFTGDSWLFYYSDTLIRLFPMRFWQDCFIYVGSITILISLALGFGLKKR